MECGESGDHQGKGNADSADEQSAVTGVGVEAGVITGMYVCKYARIDMYARTYV